MPDDSASARDAARTDDAPASVAARVRKERRESKLDSGRGDDERSERTRGLASVHRLRRPVSTWVSTWASRAPAAGNARRGPAVGSAHAPRSFHDAAAAWHP